jgi:hypothetical protein
MENAYHACYKWEKYGLVFHPIGPQDFLSFPYHDCYLHRNWDLLVQISAMIQHTSTNIHLSLTKAEFEYLKDRMIPELKSI